MTQAIVERSFLGRLAQLAITAPRRFIAVAALVANIPVLLFCIAFGLSMDYEVFLVARIREF